VVLWTANERWWCHTHIYIRVGCVCKDLYINVAIHALRLAYINAIGPAPLRGGLGGGVTCDNCTVAQLELLQAISSVQQCCGM
jgi:hypothetical protein